MFNSIKKSILFLILVMLTVAPTPSLFAAGLDQYQPAEMETMDNTSGIYAPNPDPEPPTEPPAVTPVPGPGPTTFCPVYRWFWPWSIPEECLVEADEIESDQEPQATNNRIGPQ